MLAAWRSVPPARAVGRFVVRPAHARRSISSVSLQYPRPRRVRLAGQEHLSQSHRRFLAAKPSAGKDATASADSSAAAAPAMSADLAQAIQNAGPMDGLGSSSSLNVSMPYGSFARGRGLLRSSCLFSLFYDAMCPIGSAVGIRQHGASRQGGSTGRRSRHAARQRGGRGAFCEQGGREAEAVCGLFPAGT